MFAVFYVSVLVWCFKTSAVEAELAPPQDLDMITKNTQYILSWNWDQSTARGHPVTFTAQYLAKFKLKWKKKNWATVCDGTSQTCCDMTALNLHYYGIFMFRVQASSGRNHSDWAIKEFCPDKEAALGPPSKVVLAPAGNHLDVAISDPLTSANTSMREKIPEMYYRIIYWEHSTDTQVLRKQTVNTLANLVTLSDLKAWTRYCVTVQSRYDYYNKSSSFTHPDCLQTEAGPIPWWQILLYFLVSLMICFLVVLLSLYGFYRCYTTLKATFFPSIQLPPHIQEYLCSSPGSDVPRLLTPDSEAEVTCDKLSICPEVVLLEIHDPPPSEDFPVLLSGLEPDTSGRHSRQDSGGSGDSGVYSNEGGSGLRQPPSTHSSVGMEDSWQSPSDLMQVKMQDMGSEVRGHHLITDEGIMDMCV